MRTSRFTSLRWGVVMLAVAGVRAGGQELRGSIVADSGEHTISSAIVEMLDSSDVVVAQTLSSADGGFALLAPSAGRYRIRVRRIGYRSTTSEPQHLEVGEAVNITLSATSLPVRLATVEVVGRDECPADNVPSSETAALWEEARKALLLTSLARAEHRVVVKSKRYSRDVSLVGFKITGQQTNTITGDSSALFRSAPAEILARGGYIQHDSSGMIYFAPDADVMLSETFAGTHCFQLVPDSGSRHLVGLAFRPIKGDTLPEVRGVLLLDPKTAELRAMMFHYVNGPIGVPDDPFIGGYAEFERVQSGWWVIRRWEMRMPLQVGMFIPPRKSNQDSAPPPRYQVRQVREVGGEVLEVKEAQRVANSPP